MSRVSMIPHHHELLACLLLASLATKKVRRPLYDEGWEERPSRHGWNQRVGASGVVCVWVWVRV